MPADRLHLYLSGQFAGEVFRDRHGDVQLAYDPAWVADPQSYPLSLSLPMGRNRYRPGRVRNVLNGLLPESPAVLADWQRRYRIADTSDVVQVLAAVGQEVAGAAQFVTPGEDVSTLSIGWTALLSDDEVAEMIREAREAAGAMPRVETAPRVSLAGQQAKFALARGENRWFLPLGDAPSTHIFKPAPPELADLDVVELTMMDAAERIGLRTAGSSLERIGGEQVFVSKRYDRVATDQGAARIHQEDVIQALGHPPSMKYGRHGGVNLTRLVELLRTHDAAPGDIDELIRLTAFNVAIGNADAHGKNHSLLIQPGGTVRLAPAYDLASLAPYPGYQQELAFPVGRQWDYRRVGQADWVQLARDLELDPDRVLRLVGSVWEAIPGAVDAALDSAGAPEHVRGPILQLVDSLGDRLPPSGGQSVGQSVAATEVWVRSHSRGGRNVQGHWRRTAQRS